MSLLLRGYGSEEVSRHDPDGVGGRVEELGAYGGDVDLVALTIDGIAPALDQPAVLEGIDEHDHGRAVDFLTPGQTLGRAEPSASTTVSTARTASRRPSSSSGASAGARIA